MVRQHFLRITHCREVVHTVPFLQQLQIVQQLRHLRIRQRQLQGIQTLQQCFLQRSHQASPFCADVWPKSLRDFFRWISNREIAAGVMPLMRDA